MASYAEVKLTDCVCISAAGECRPLLGQYTLNCSAKKWEHYKIDWWCTLYITHSTTSAPNSPGKTKVHWKTDKLIQLGGESERIQHKYNLQPTFYIQDKGLTSYKRKYAIRGVYNQHNKA